MLSRKLVVVGPFSVGKTSLVRRHVENRFDQEYQATLGVACFTKNLTLSDGQELRQIIWDVEGGQAKQRVFQTYIQGAAAALLVADMSRPDTLELLADYFDDLQTACPGIPMAVALNKADLVDATQVKTSLEMVGRRFGDLVQPTSAATGQSVEELFKTLGEKVV